MRGSTSGPRPSPASRTMPLASTWNKVGNLLYRHAENFYHFEGLKSFKQKFNPGLDPAICLHARRLRASDRALRHHRPDLRRPAWSSGAMTRLRSMIRRAGVLDLRSQPFLLTAEATSSSASLTFPHASAACAVAIIYSGDGGWQDLDKTIGEWMAAKDIHVIGVSTMKAFWEAREPEAGRGRHRKDARRCRPDRHAARDAHRLFVRRRHPAFRLATS